VALGDRRRVVADPARISDRLARLWAISQGPGGGADRPAYSPAEAAAMRQVADWAAEIDLEPRIDRFGNLWALPAGWDGPLLTTGSHVDTVPDGGRYDGALGTVLGLELVAGLGDAAGPEASARGGLLVCAAEEAPRFGAGTVGSRLLTGRLSPDELAALCDADGVSAAEALAGYLEALADLPRLDEPPRARVRAHAEVHVALRFGPAELGIVTRVASPRRLEVTLTGDPGHAGEVAMEDRRDALAGAAEVVLAIEAAARAQPRETVATVGTLAVAPGAVTTIPGSARLGIDMRGVDAGSLDGLETAVRAAVEAIAGRRRLEAETVRTRTGSPVALAPELVDAALDAARRLDIPAAETWSGAGHDAQHIAAFAPALLVFVPLHDGQSHTPREGAKLDEILWAADVVGAVLTSLAA
jgi:hydantoinase/carbamoylase family amidase